MRVNLHELVCLAEAPPGGKPEYKTCLIATPLAMREVNWSHSWGEVFQKLVAEVDLGTALLIGNRTDMATTRHLLVNVRMHSILKSRQLSEKEYKQAKDRLLAEQPEQPLPKRRLDLNICE